MHTETLLPPAPTFALPRYRVPGNRADIEMALDTSRLYVNVGRGKWWLCRRNGATKTWKRDAARYYIPFKAGFRDYGNVTEGSRLDVFRIATSRDDAESE